MSMIQISPISDLRNQFDYIENALDAADFDAKNNPTRYTHEEVFDTIREKIKNNYKA